MEATGPIKNKTDKAGALLRAARKHRKITMRRLSQLTGIHVNILRRIEIGAVEMKLEAFVRYSSAIGVPPHKVLARLLTTPEEVGIQEITT